MIRRFTTTVAATIFGLGVLTGVPVAANAAPTPHPAAAPSRAARQAALRPLRGLRVGAPGRPAGPGTARQAGQPTLISYYNWAGYADDSSSGNTYTYASGSWVEPTITCPPHELQVAVFWVGLDGFSNNTVEQEGTYAECYDGQAFYYSWWEMYPTNDIQLVGTDVAPGDRISASTTFANGHYTLKLTDHTTTANSFTTTQTCGSGLSCSRASAEWIAESPSGSRGLYPLPNFGTWRLTAAKVYSGSTHGVISTFPDDQINMVSDAPYNLVSAQPLSSSGNAFSCVWHNSY